MNIAVIGTGYVGLVTGTCLADYGNNVYCVDVNQDKIEKLKKGQIPIFEPGLEEMVKENSEGGRLRFTTNLEEALHKSEICFIAVGTPMGEDGSADLQYVVEVAHNIGKAMRHRMYIIDKSTVPVGTAKLVKTAIQEELDKRGEKIAFDVISNPEFLKEGTAVEDCSRPDRIIIGTDNEECVKVMRKLYMPLVKNTEAMIIMDIASAEMTKYAANAMLATKISFMNEMANICERVGANVNKVRLGIGSDHRIGYQFIYPGCGYGGSCFPKDVQALIKTSDTYGYDCKILRAVEEVNAKQKQIIPQKVVKRFGENLEGKTFAIWGLAFKPKTDDMRMSAAITIINELTARGAKIKAYDPKAMDMAKEVYLKNNKNVEYSENMYTCLVEADAMIMVTEWKEFRQPDFDEIKKRLRQPVIFDGRNQYDIHELKNIGIEYYQIGVCNE